MNARTNKAWAVTAIHNKPGIDSYITEYRVDTSDGRQNIVRMTGTDAEDHDNAALIAEAGTVCHETGLTPRQLAEQPKELMEALQFVRKYITMRIDRGNQFPSQLTSAIDGALAKAVRP
jgi:hypothetical protein